jgi:hypothetical protein
MIRVNNFVRALALSTVMFGAGATVATVVLSYLPIVNATPTKVAQGLKQSKAEETDEEYGFKFRVQDCKRSGKTVVCNVLATNLKNENQKIWIFWGGGGVRSRVIDSSGNQYIAKQTQIGSSIIKGDNGGLAADLIAGIPTKLIYSFDIPPEVTNLAAIEVNYQMSGASSEYRKVAIRDITIGGSQASNPSNPGTKCTCPPQTNPKKPRAK